MSDLTTSIRVLVPETAMYEDNLAARPKYQIGLSRQVFAV